MEEDIKILILNLIKKGRQKEYTIPDVQRDLGLKTREKVAIALREMELEGKLNSRKKGRTKLYSLK